MRGIMALSTTWLFFKLPVHCQQIKMLRGKCGRIGALNFALASMLSLTCHADRPPTDNELKAAYCLKIYQAQIQIGNELSSLVPKDLQDSKVQSEMRLRGYLFPRLQSLDADELLFATRRAEEDFDSYKNTPCYLATREFKDKPILQLSKKQREEFQQCYESITNSAAAKRIGSCDNLSWLPF